MRNRNLLVAVMFAGTAGFTGFARAQAAAPATPAPAAAAMAAPEETETTEMQHLRAARKMLNEAKDTFEKDPVDKADHRKAAIEGIDKAIAAIDAEIDEYKADNKK